MPPLRFADLPGLRLGYYEAGPADDAAPLVLLHGWPELAFSWRHQIAAFAKAGRRVIAPDQRGYGATPGPQAVSVSASPHSGHRFGRGSTWPQWWHTSVLRKR